MCFMQPFINLLCATSAFQTELESYGCFFLIIYYFIYIFAIISIIIYVMLFL